MDTFHYQAMEDRTFCYHIKQLEKKFHLKDPEIQLIIPAAHGNDFIEHGQSDSESIEPIEAIFEDISKYDSCEEYLETADDHLRGRFSRAKEQYCVLPLPTDHDLEENPASSENFEKYVPQCVIQRLRKGCFSPKLLSVCVHESQIVVEDIKQNSAWLASSNIRQYLYGFMGKSAKLKVTEYI